jgi:hypothetical protein
VDAYLRVLAGVLGVLVLYVAWFVYEDEEKRMQNVIEQWWLSLNELSSTTRSRQAALTAFVSRKAVDSINRFYGAPIWSTGGLIASSTMVILIAVVLGGIATSLLANSVPFGSAQPPRSEAEAQVTLLALVIYLLALIPCLLAAFSPRRRPWRRWIVVVWFGLNFYFVVDGFMRFFEGRIQASAFVFVLLGHLFLFCVAPVVVCGVAVCMRYAFTVAARSGSEWWPFVLAAGVVLLTLALVTLTGYTGLTRNEQIYVLSALLFPSLLFIPMLSLVTLIAGLLLLHRLMWPFIERVLYSWQRYKVVQNKKLLNAAGTALFGFALASEATWERIGKILAIGAG